MEVGYCSGIENYSRHLSRPQAGRDAQHAARLLPAGQPAHHRRVARDGPADPGHVRRRLQPQEHAGRARVPAPQRAGQPAAAVRRVGEEVRASGSSSRPRRATTRSRCPAARSSSRSSGPTGLVDPIVRVEPARGQVPALLEEVRSPRREGRAGADHHADQAAGRGPVALPQGAGPAVQVAALRARRLRARDHPPRAARGGLRRPGGRQPAARGARPARGLDGLHPRRRQGGLPPQRDLADPDDRPVGPARQRRGRALRRQDHPVDAAGHRRDQAPPRRCNWRTTPSTASRPRRSSRRSAAGSRRRSRPRPIARKAVGRDEATDATEEYLAALEAEMLDAAEKLEFERAAALRDKILELRSAQGGGPAPPGRQPAGRLRPGQGQGRRRPEGRAPAQAALIRRTLVGRTTMTQRIDAPTAPRLLTEDDVATIVAEAVARTNGPGQGAPGQSRLERRSFLPAPHRGSRSLPVARRECLVGRVGRVAARTVTQANEAQFVMETRVGESCRSSTLQLVLPSKPLTEPMPRVAVNGSVGRAHRSQTKVVRPSQELLVQFRHSIFDRHPQPSSAGQLVDLGLEAVDLLRRRGRPDGRAPRPRRVTPSDCVTQEVHALLGQAAQPRLGLVHRQPQLRHHRSHHPNRLVGGVAATVPEVSATTKKLQSANNCAHVRGPG